MSRFTEIVKWSFSKAGRFLISIQNRRVQAYRRQFVKLSDEALRDQCREALSSGDGSSPDEQFPTDARSIGERIVERMASLFKIAPKALNSDLRNVSLGTTAFDRAPADLPPDSRLFPEQIEAAIALTGRSVLQMDTGEGKTYAILPAAFALACKYGRVYIVCANDYLAWRDARRTRPFWEFVGLTPGLGLVDSPGLDESEWSNRVVYTTADSILIKLLRDDMRMHPTSHPITFSAAILDEADATLLDQAAIGNAIAKSIQASDFDWKFAIELAFSLDEKEDVDIDLAKSKATLTVGGEEKLRELLKRSNREEPYLLMRHLVETSFYGIRVARQGVNYVIESNQVMAVNSTTGRIERNRNFAWIAPLESHLSLPSRPKHISVHYCNNAILFRRFSFISGASGTILADVFTYFFNYRLYPVVIPRRTQKYDGFEDDRVYKSREVAIQSLVADVRQASEMGRPVLIGTQTISDAETIYQRLKNELPETANLNLLTGKNDHDMRTVFANAGDPHSVSVVTQLAGRGIDIRLTHESRAMGGILLIGFAHGMESRFDKQFQGRVGRQSDPFTSYFICSLDDELFRTFTGPKFRATLSALGFQDDDEMRHRFLTKSIARAQRNIRRMRMQSDIGQSYLNEAGLMIYTGFRSWFEYVQLEPSETDSQDPDQGSSAFISIVIERFLEQTLWQIVGKNRHRILSHEEADAIVHSIANALETDVNALPFKTQYFAGFEAENAAVTISESLKEKIAASTEANAAFRQDYRKRMDYQFDIRHWLRSCREWKGEIERVVQDAVVESEPADYISTETEPLPFDSDAVNDNITIKPHDLFGADDHPLPNRTIHRPRLRSSKAKAVAAIADEVKLQNARLSDDPQANPTQALDAVQQVCIASDLDEYIRPTLSGNSIQLTQAQEFEGTSRTAPRAPDGSPTAVEQHLSDLEFKLLIAELLVDGTISPAASANQDEGTDSIMLSPGSAPRQFEWVEAILSDTNVTADDCWQSLYEKTEALNPRLLNRTPRAIANQVVQTASIEFLNERDRLYHRAAQPRASTLYYYRTVYDGLVRTWNKMDAIIPSRILTNLIAGRNPEDLDKLFWYDDHHSAANTPDVKRQLPWKSTKSSPKALTHQQNVIDLANQFIRLESQRDTQNSHEETMARRLILDFLDSNPLHSLRSPDVILDRLNTFFQEDRMRGVSTSAARKRRRTLQRLLHFLRERMLVGKLPRFRTVCFSWVKRMIASVTERGTAFILIPAVFAITVFSLLSIFVRPNRPVSFEGVAGLFETIVFADLMRLGSITAPAVGGLILGAAAARFLQPRRQDIPDGTGLDRLFVPVFQTGLAIWLVPWASIDSIVDGVFAAAVLATAVFVSVMTMKIAISTAAQTAISLKSGWIAFILPVYFLPYVFDYTTADLNMGFACLLAFTVVYYLWMRINYKELTVTSVHLPSAGENDTPEFMKTSHRVSADCGCRPHVYALLFSVAGLSMMQWIGVSHLLGLSDSLVFSQVSAVVIYALVVVMWNRVIISRRFSPLLWRQTLNQKHQELEGIDRPEELESMLSGMRNAVFLRELGFQGLVLAGAMILFNGLSFGKTEFPVGLIVIGAGFLFADQAKVFCHQVYQHLLSRIPVIENEMDLSTTKEPLIAQTGWDRLRVILKNGFEPTLTVLAVLFGLIEAVKWIVGLFN